MSEIRNERYEGVLDIVEEDGREIHKLKEEIERLTRERDERENNVGLAMEAEYLKGYAAGLAEGREDEE